MTEYGCRSFTTFPVGCAKRCAVRLVRYGASVRLALLGSPYGALTYQMRRRHR